MTQIDDQRYAGIAIKSVNAIPQYCWINDSFPQMQLTMWPIPFAPMTLNDLSAGVELDGPAAAVHDADAPARV